MMCFIQAVESNKPCKYVGLSSTFTYEYTLGHTLSTHYIVYASEVWNIFLTALMDL